MSKRAGGFARGSCCQELAPSPQRLKGYHKGNTQRQVLLQRMLLVPLFSVKRSFGDSPWYEGHQDNYSIWIPGKAFCTPFILVFASVTHSTVASSACSCGVTLPASLNSVRNFKYIIFWEVFLLMGGCAGANAASLRRSCGSRRCIPGS